MTERPQIEDAASAKTSEVASMLTRLGGVLLSLETVQTTVELVTRLAAETIPGTAGAGVTLVDGRGHRTTAASDPFVAEADALQYAFDSGPCLTAWADQTPVRVDDLTVETRWPEWTAAAAGLEVLSVLSVPLLAPTTAPGKAAVDSVGAMKVYSRNRHAYDAHAEEVLSLFARQASVLLTNMSTLSDARRLSVELSDALQTRDVIGQAKGMLMAQGAADHEEAFAMLVSASQRTNVKVHVVARQFIASVVGRRSGSGRQG